MRSNKVVKLIFKCSVFGFPMAALFIFSAISCQKNAIISSSSDTSFVQKGSIKKKGQLSFIIMPGNVNPTQKTHSINPGIKSIIVSIEDLKGNKIWNLDTIKLGKSGNDYTCFDSINVGSYKLTRFFALDSTGTIAFATPLANSSKAGLVNNPLPIQFSVIYKQLTSILPEILNVYKSDTSGFGISPGYQVIDSFSFLISVSVLNSVTQSYEFTDASLTISDGTTDLYILPIAAKINQISIKSGLKSYTLKVSKSGFETYTSIFTVDSLRACYAKPLSITLQPLTIDLTAGLVAYYPFNGNANDESGNGNNGTVYGATLATDRFGNANKAYDFNGINNFIEFSNKFDILTRTIDLWFYADDADYSSSYGSIYQSDNQNLLYGNTGVAIKDIGGLKKLLLTISGVTDTINIITNSWNNLAITVNANKEINYYYNGILIGSKTFIQYVSSVDGLDIAIIGSSRLAYNQYFKGKIDDVRIYNRALSNNEIQLLYNETK